jgi:hypothetical protein
MLDGCDGVAASELGSRALQKLKDRLAVQSEVDHMGDVSVA